MSLGDLEPIVKSHSRELEELKANIVHLSRAVHELGEHIDQLTDQVHKFARATAVITGALRDDTLPATGT